MAIKGLPKIFSLSRYHSPRCVLETLKDISKTILATDKRFCRDVRIICEDGSSFFYHCAFLVSLPHDWIGVITEHYGDILFHKDDLYCHAEYLRVRPSCED